MRKRGEGVLQCIHAQCWKREHKHDNIAWHFLLESIVFINIIRLLDSIFFFQQILEILKISQWQIFLSCDFLFELGKQKKKTALENDIKISFDSIPFCFFRFSRAIHAFCVPLLEEWAGREGAAALTKSIEINYKMNY